MAYNFNPFTGKLDDTGDFSANPEVTAIYFGDSETDGSWRILVSSNNLSMQRRESGVWVEKSAATP